MGNLRDALKLGQSIWIDYIRRDLITGGQLRQLVDQGLRGMTSNPTIFNKAIAESNLYDDAIRDIIRSNPGVNTKALYDRLIIEDIQTAADVFRPVYETSAGMDGFVSLEPPAQFAYDTEATVKEVRRLWKLADRPNVMMKVPATPAGIPAIQALTGEGININITLMFSLKHYEDVSHAYIRGITECAYPGKVTSVASFFVSRVDTYVDRELEQISTKEALALRGKAAVANSKLVYRRFREIFFGEEFAIQKRRGAHIQRVLWGSTSTKNPLYPDLLYVEELMGPDTINTVPLETLQKFQEHGKTGRTLDEGLEEAERVLSVLKKVGVNLESVTEQLQKDGVKAFADSLDQLLNSLEEKRRKITLAV